MKKSRLQTYVPATPEQLKNISLKIPLQDRDLAICELLLFHRCLTQDQIDFALFREPGTKRSRVWDRLHRLYHHRFIDRINVQGVTVYLLLNRGRDEIARRRKVNPNTLDFDEGQNKRSIEHWQHLLSNNDIRMLIIKAVNCLNSLEALADATLEENIQVVAKEYIETGWSRKRVFEKVNYLLYLEQTQSVQDSVTWLKRAIEKNTPKPKGFSIKALTSPLSLEDTSEAGYQLLDWRTDLELSRLKKNERLEVKYTPLNEEGARPGQVEFDDEFTIAHFSRGSSSPSRSYTLMGEYDAGTRSIQNKNAPFRVADDNSFTVKMMKAVAMLESKIYQDVRGKRLDRIFIVLNAKRPKAIEDRVRMIEKCGGMNAFLVTSIATLKNLRNPSHVLTAPVWRRCGETTEQYYPLIGASSLDRCLREARQRADQTEADIAVTELREDIYEAARRELHISLLSELDQTKMQQLIKESQKGALAANTWLTRWYSQCYGSTYLQSLAIFADLEAERHMEEMK